MSTDNDKTAELTRVRDHHACPSCGGPTSTHEETVIQLGHPDRVRFRHLCRDPRCGGASLAVESTSMGKTGVTE